MTTNNQDRSLFTALNPFRRNKKSSAVGFVAASPTHDGTAMLSLHFDTASYHQFPVWRSL
jgi:hypothetical protein